MGHDLEGLAIFPENGIDQSLHAPVLVGLLILTFFRETLGWGYAGLVVPGYLAAVFLAAPVTGALMVVEGIIGYLLAALVGVWLPRTGAWSELFGRERFLLVIVCSLLTRLGLEALWIPHWVELYGLEHSRELYSIGLVLVPLLANSFWNAGLLKSLPHVAVVTTLTFLFLDHVLLTHTNFSLARFQIANESVSLAFLETPHAHIILVLGAVLAARDNVLYGWDYNGILVPALLAVAWYEPTKLLTTVVEALVVLGLARAITQLPPFSRILMVGSRRMVLCYGVGFVVKWVLGVVALRVAPSLQTIDYFGFGYLLPSLLAIKMWNTDKIGRVLMPTLQVSLSAFLLGNLLSIGLAWADPRPAPETAGSRIETRASLPLGLVLGDTAPAPRLERVPWGELTLSQHVLRLTDRVGGLEPGKALPGLGVPPGLRVERTTDGFWLFTPRSLDPNDDRACPRVALRPRSVSRPWLVLVDAPAVGAPELVVAARIATLLQARALAIRSRLPQVSELDDAFLGDLLRRQHIEQILVVERGTESGLSLVGRVPEALSVRALGEVTGGPVEVSFRPVDPEDRPYANRPRLTLARAEAEAAAARILGAPALVVWPEPLRVSLSTRARELTSVLPGQFEAPDIEELRLFSSVLASGLADGTLESRGAYARALAGTAGYRFARIGDEDHDPEAWALFEPASPARRGQATLVLRAEVPDRKLENLMVELPAPRFERGALDASLTLFEGLDARALLVAGALPTAAPEHAADPRRAGGHRLHYQVLHEAFLQAGGNALSVHGLAPERQLDFDVLLSFQRPAPSPVSGPPFSHPIARMLMDNGFQLRSVDGSPELEPFSGALDPPMAYARRFAGQQMAMLWLSAEARTLFSTRRSDQVTEARVRRQGLALGPTDVADLGRTLADCATRPSGTGCPPPHEACEADGVLDALERYNQLRNPHELEQALRLAERCHLEIVRDRRSDLIWVALSGSGQVWLAPLRPGPPRPRRTPRPGDLDRAVALGLSALAVTGGP